MRREIWHLTEGLIFVHFATFILAAMQPESVSLLVLNPNTVAARPWTVVTFQFIHGHMLWFFFSMNVLWIMGRTLEEEWGSFRFLLFWAVSVAGAAITSILLGQPLAGDIFLGASLLFTFATLYPDTEFLLALIIPVKVKYLAIVAGAFLAFGYLQLGLLKGAASVVGMSAGYAFFLITRRLPSRRKVGFEIQKKKAAIEVAIEDSAAKRKNETWDPLVRAAVDRARDLGRIADDDEPLLADLDSARDPEVTVCAPDDFNFVDDDVCRTCLGYAECAARRIRLTAEAGADSAD